MSSPEVNANGPVVLLRRIAGSGPRVGGRGRPEVNPIGGQGGGCTFAGFCLLTHQAEGGRREREVSETHDKMINI